MDYIYLGRTGLEVSRICFGALTIGPLQANLPLSEGAGVVAHALDRGINFFDTAQIYETYPYIKKGMEISGKNAVISTKTYAYNKKMAAEAVDEARKELDRDYIDIFMLHEQESIHTLNGHREALDFLYECKEKGIIKAVGASMHHVAAVYGAKEYKLDVIHPLLNMNGLGIPDGERSDMEKAVNSAYSDGIGIFSMKPLGGGNLFKNASDCLNYCFSKNYIHSIAIGMQSIEEVDANVDFYMNGFFSEDSKGKLLKKQRVIHIDEWCSGCGACEHRCGQGAIKIINSVAVPDEEKCILCGYCSSVCPEWAIKIV